MIHNVYQLGVGNVHARILCHTRHGVHGQRGVQAPQLPRQCQRGVGLVGAQHLLALRLKIRKSLLVVCHCRINVRMIIVNRRNTRQPGMIMQKIAVVFIGFVDKIFRLRVVFTGRPKRQIATHQIRYRNFQLMTGPDNHCCGGGFAVRPGHGHHF